MNKDEALKLALEALKHLQPTALTSFYTIGARDKAITAIKQAYSAPVQSCYCPNCEAMGKELAALKAQPAPVQEPVLEVVNGQINRSWDAIPAGFTGMLYMQSRSSVPPKKPQEPWYGSARVDDYNRGWNDCIDSINATLQPLHMPQPWGTYMGHRMTPAGTKEFWGVADAPIPEGTKLYTTPPAAQRQWFGLTDEEIDHTEWIPKRGSHITYDIGWLDNMRIFARAIEAKLKEKNT